MGLGAGDRPGWRKRASTGATATDLLVLALHMKPLDQPGKKKRILLAEKESTGRYLLLQQLNKAGLEVELAPNGALALKKLGEMEVDAIILDSSLPM